MSSRTDYAPGTFCWTELSTSDAEGAKAFYGAVLGWEAHDMPDGHGATYTLLRLGEDDVAALYQRAEQRTLPHWLCYVSAESADSTAARAAELGGTVVAEPFDVMQAGRMAVLQDPQEAVFAVWEPGEHIGATRVNEPGALSWNDLQTTDLDGARAFYSELFGWTIADTPGAEGNYLTIGNGEVTNGGVMRMPPSLADQGIPPYWQAYFAVESLEDALERVTEHGGTALTQPMDVPAGRFAAVRDPQGASFSLFAGDLDP